METTSEETFLDLLSQLSALQIGVVLLAIVFLIVGLRLVFKKPPATLTAFSGDAGNVLVSRKALQELVKQACLLDEAVEAARPVIQVKNQQVAARVELRLSEPENLKEVCQRVQDRIVSLMQKSLSIEQIGSIQIVVKSFGPDGEDRPATKSESSAIEPPDSASSKPSSDSTPPVA